MEEGQPVNPSTTKSKRKRPTQQGTDDEGSDEEEALSRLHPDDPDNFVKLSTALRLLLARELEEDDIETADELLREYCTELIEVCVYIHYPCF